MTTAGQGRRSRTHLAAFLCAAGLVTVAAGAVRAQEGQTRWRLSGSNQLLLIMSASEATDAYGFPYFSCRKGSGLITVAADMVDAQRDQYAEWIKRDEAPVISLEPPDAQSVASAEYSSMDGWLYKFDISADAEAFRAFMKTGTFKYNFGTSGVSTSLAVGLENVQKFQAACRRLPPG